MVFFEPEKQFTNKSLVRITEAQAFVISILAQMILFGINEKDQNLDIRTISIRDLVSVALNISKSQGSEKYFGHHEANLLLEFGNLHLSDLYKIKLDPVCLCLVITPSSNEVFWGIRYAISEIFADMDGVAIPININLWNEQYCNATKRRVPFKDIVSVRNEDIFLHSRLNAIKGFIFSVPISIDWDRIHVVTNVELIAEKEQAEKVLKEQEALLRKKQSDDRAAKKAAKQSAVKVTPVVTPKERPSKFYTMKEVIQLTGLTRSTILSKIKPNGRYFDDTFPNKAYKVNGNIIFSKPAIDDWIKKTNTPVEK